MWLMVFLINIAATYFLMEFAQSRLTDGICDDLCGKSLLPYKAVSVP